MAHRRTARCLPLIGIVRKGLESFHTIFGAGAIWADVYRLRGYAIRIGATPSGLILEFKFTRALSEDVEAAWASVDPL